MADPIVAIAGLGKRFDGNDAPALSDLTLDIAANSFFTLLGPSGCGKSTLLRCLAGLEHPDAGTIRIDGLVVFSTADRVATPPNRRGLGMVFQSYAIWPHMTVGENVAFPLQARGGRGAAKADITRRVRDALALVGLDGLADRPASRLSGGQQQRVALARAVVGEPKLLLLDEPLSNLDTALREQMRGELQRLQRRLGLTVVNVTHDQGEALSLSDRIAVMAAGKLVEVGTPRELYEMPQTAFVARFVGGGNVLHGEARPYTDGMMRVATPVGPIVMQGQASGQVALFIRPERIELEPAPGDPCPNRIACRLVGQRYVGNATELDAVALGDGVSVLSIRTAASLPPLSEMVTLHIDPAHVRLLASPE